MIKQAYRDGNADRQPGWRFHATYDADQVEALKRAIPHTHREWNSQTQMWWVHEDYAEALEGVYPDFAQYRQQLSMF